MRLICLTKLTKYFSNNYFINCRKNIQRKFVVCLTLTFRYLILFYSMKASVSIICVDSEKLSPTNTWQRPRLQIHHPRNRQHNYERLRQQSKDSYWSTLERTSHFWKYLRTGFACLFDQENLKVGNKCNTIQTAEELESTFAPGSTFGFNAILEFESESETPDSSSSEE